MVARIVAISALLAVVALYCYYTAKRLDRLHRRMDAAAAALDAQLRRRTTAVEVMAAATEVGASHRLTLADAAAATSAVTGLNHDREVVENALSRLLAALADKRPDLFLSPTARVIEVHDEALRATIATRFYNDTVRDTLVVRDRRAVRWLGLAGRAPHPAYFEMDDEELPTPQISLASQA